MSAGTPGGVRQAKLVGASFEIGPQCRNVGFAEQPVANRRDAAHASLSRPPDQRLHADMQSLGHDGERRKIVPGVLTFRGRRAWTCGPSGRGSNNLK